MVIAFAKPVPPSAAITMTLSTTLHGVGGVYLFDVTGYPTGENRPALAPPCVMARSYPCATVANRTEVAGIGAWSGPCPPFSALSMPRP